MTKFLRTSTSLLASLALIATLAVVCPCPASEAEASAGDHGCCASEGISAADSCCDAAAVPQDGTLAPTVPPTVAPAGLVLPALAPEPTGGGAEHRSPAPDAFRSPPILRI